MATAVIMPRQGQSVESCIIEWKVKEGDSVNVGDILFGYETDKASFEEENQAAGTVLKLLAEDGDDVDCLSNVCVIGKPGDDISEFVSEQKPKNIAKDAPKEEQEAVISKEQKIEPIVTEAKADITKISPRAKGTAARQNLDLTKAMPTGPNGRIIERDVMVLADKGYKVTSAANAAYQGNSQGSGLGGAVTTSDLSAVPMAAPSASAADDYTDVKLSGVRKAIAKAMHASLSELAQLTLSSSFDATAILSFRSKIKANMESMGLANITLNDIVLFAAVKTLENHPDVNAHFLGDKIRRFNSVNLGMAVDTDRGLLVPTLFGADTMSLSQLSAGAKQLAANAQSGKISPDLLSGGTFTVTNLGALGVENFTPVINPPQTGILGVCNITYKQKKVADEFVTYPAMGLSLTFDHRAVDGAPAARYLKDLCNSLENFDVLLSI